MYIPKLEDVRFTPWRVVDGEAISNAMIYLADDISPNDVESTGRTFGYKVTAKVSGSAGNEEKLKALKQAQDQVVQNFDVIQAGKNQDFDGDYNNLQPIETANVVKLKEMQSVPAKV